MVADGVAGSHDRLENGHVTVTKVFVVIAAGALGALLAVGSLVAALFERQGFGDRDGEPSTAYLLGLALAFGLSVALPLVAWRLLLPRSFSLPAAAVAALAGLAGAAWVLGAGA